MFFHNPTSPLPLPSPRLPTFRYSSTTCPKSLNSTPRQLLENLDTVKSALVEAVRADVLKPMEAGITALKAKHKMV